MLSLFCSVVCVFNWLHFDISCLAPNYRISAKPLFTTTEPSKLCKHVQKYRDGVVAYVAWAQIRGKNSCSLMHGIDRAARVYVLFTQVLILLLIYLVEHSSVFFCCFSLLFADLARLSMCQRRFCCLCFVFFVLFYSFYFFIVFFFFLPGWPGPAFLRLIIAIF